MRVELGERRAISEIRREVLSRSIFGVDRSPMAVWMSELRLWLSVVIDSDERDPALVQPLPNLDRNIRVGDALTGAPFQRGGPVIIGSALMADLRQRYVRATGRRKQTLARRLDLEERRRFLAQLDRNRGDIRALMSDIRTRTASLRERTVART